MRTKNTNVEHQIQKSRPLQAIQQCHLSMMSYRIMDTFLNKVNIHNPEEDTIIISKKELENIWGKVNIETKDLKQTLKVLMQTVEYTFENKTILFHLFDIAEIKIGKTGAQEVKLVCGKTAKQYVFNIENLGYLKYSLAEISSFTSKYSYLLYLYLKNCVKQYRGKEWTIGVEELKVILDIYDEKKQEYKATEYLSRVLKRAKIDIEAKTDMEFTYCTEKDGVVVKGIKFHVQKKSVISTIHEIEEHDRFSAWKEKDDDYQKRLEDDEEFRKAEIKRGKKQEAAGQLRMKRAESACKNKNERQ